MPDAILPYVQPLLPEEGSVGVGRASPFDYKIVDYGGSGLDSATLVVSVTINGGAPVVLTNAGVLQNGVGWDSSYVRYYAEGAASLADLRLQKDVLFSYEDTVEVSITVSDTDSNNGGTVSSYVIRDKPTYDGSAPTPLETEMSTAFVSDVPLENLRSYLMTNLVSDAGANSEERCARRALQALTALGEHPFVRWTWGEDPEDNRVPADNGVAIKALEASEGILGNYMVLALNSLRQKVDSSYLEFAEARSRALGKDGKLAGSILALVVACRLRSNGDL